MKYYIVDKDNIKLEIQPARIFRIVEKKDHLIAKDGVLFMDYMIYDEIVSGQPLQPILDRFGTINYGPQLNSFFRFDKGPYKLEIS